MNKKLALGIIVFVLIAAAAGYKLFFTKEKGITATGTIEITHADVVPKVGGYITGLKIIAGDAVTSGQVVATIKRSDMEAQLKADQAAAVKAQKVLADLQKGPREAELQQARANLAGAQAVYSKADNDLKRYQALYQSAAIAAQQLDAAQSAYQVAYNSLAAAQAGYNLLLEGNRPDAIAAQQAEVERTQAVVKATQANLADTIVYSPLNGVVLTKNYENGEYVNPGSALLTIGDLQDCWVKIYVSSAELGLIKLGEPVKVRIDAYPNRIFAGTIKEISQNAEFTPRQSITKQERANLVFYVKVKLDNSEGILKPGMPADVVIQ